MKNEIMAEALREIRDHDPKTCPGLDEKDCLDKVQEIARATLEWAKDAIPINVDETYVLLGIEENGVDSRFFTLSASDYSEARQKAADFCRKNGLRYFGIMQLHAALSASGIYSVGFRDAFHDH